MQQTSAPLPTMCSCSSVTWCYWFHCVPNVCTWKVLVWVLESPRIDPNYNFVWPIRYWKSCCVWRAWTAVFCSADEQAAASGHGWGCCWWSRPTYAAPAAGVSLTCIRIIGVIVCHASSNMCECVCCFCLLIIFYFSTYLIIFVWWVVWVWCRCCLPLLSFVPLLHLNILN